MTVFFAECPVKPVVMTPCHYNDTKLINVVYTVRKVQRSLLNVSGRFIL